MSPDIVLLTEQKIKSAFEVLSKAARARKASGVLDPSLIAHRKQQQKNKALAIKCDEPHDPIYQSLAVALPEDMKELFQRYALMVLAPYAVTQESFRTFRSSHRRPRKLLALQR